MICLSMCNGRMHYWTVLDSKLHYLMANKLEKVLLVTVKCESKNYVRVEIN
jgi:hypothetical protein